MQWNRATSMPSSWTSITRAIRLRGRRGLELLNRIQVLDGTPARHRDDRVGVPSKLAVEAMRRGARDFIQKPWDNARLSAILKTQIELGRALRKGQRLEAEKSRPCGPSVFRN